MTPGAPDREMLQQRLRLVSQMLDDLAPYVGRSGDELTQDRTSRYVVERLVTAVVELAVSVNSHVAAAALKEAPGTYRDSFFAAARAGWMEEDLAAALAPAAGLRNILVHAYGDIDVQLLAAALPAFVDGFERWVQQVAAQLTT